MAKVSIVGAGSWGTALSKVLADNKHDVTVWSILEDEINMLREKKEHLTKLPGVTLPDSITYTTDLKQACTGMDIIVMAVPSPYVRSTAKSMKDLIADGQRIVNVAKGIEDESYLTLTEIIQQEIPQSVPCVLSGPSHAEEVGRELTTTLVAGAEKKEDAELIQNLFMCDYLRVYTSSDVLGIELGGALKNVIALAAGISDGLGQGDNAKAAIITRGIAEISKLGIAMGGKQESFTGLTGIGDLIVTCSSMHSRNRRAGILIGQGKTMKEAMDEVQMVVEGVYSAKAARGLAVKYNISMPIVTSVNEILFEGKSPATALAELMMRDRKPEGGSVDWNPNT
ncbi:MAG: NAD(P)H-dependent glycerol-3-phosphate dehydrogenase [Lachnospiraceae bacterium]|nr:NAD(P)H-dependent glycerol-3-phosphate dehydrogenase [Lachnospiraceae bacterium]